MFVRPYSTVGSFRGGLQTLPLGLAKKIGDDKVGPCNLKGFYVHRAPRRFTW